MARSVIDRPLLIHSIGRGCGPTIHSRGLAHQSNTERSIWGGEQLSSCLAKRLKVFNSEIAIVIP